MHNYKALKAASKASVQKVKVVDKPAVEAVEEVKDGDGLITTHAVHAGAERSHEELQVVCKSFHPQTGEAQDDSVKVYSLSQVKRDIDYCKAQVVKIQAEQAEWEQIETDLKAL
jgi:hypothetical protein